MNCFCGLEEIYYFITEMRICEISLLASRAVLLLRLFLTLLDIFDIQTDSLAQLDERLGHVFSEVSDENSANYHVHD